MSDGSPYPWDDDGPEPTDAEFDDALAILARDRLDIFTQYVMRNEQPSAAEVDAEGIGDDAETPEEAADERRRILSLFTDLQGTADPDDDDADGITLQPYHRDLLYHLTTQKRLAVTAHAEAGKTQLGIAYILWALGKNPNLRVAIVSEGGKLARLICKTIARYIADESFTGCKQLRKVFPNLRPGASWNAIDGYEVVRSPAITSPSFAAFGSETGITGYRVDIAMLDDYVTPKTTATVYLRNQLTRKFETTVLNRPTKHGQIVFFCNAQYDDDTVAQFESKKGVFGFRMSVTKDGTPEGPLEWPEKWPRWRILEAVAQNPDHRSALFAERRKTGEYGRFSQAAIDLSLAQGRGLAFVHAMPEVPPGWVICIGVDFAFTKSKSSDKSAIVVLARRADGVRQVLDVIAGKWTEAEGLERLRQVVSRFPESRVRAENNGAQKWIVERWSSELRIAIEPWHTSGKKWHPVLGVPGLAAAMQNGQYALPCDESMAAPAYIRQLIEELRAFDPDPDKHTGDLVMALFFAEGLAMDSAKYGNFQYRTATLGKDPPPPKDEDEDEDDKPKKLEPLPLDAPPRPKPKPPAGYASILGGRIGR